MLLLEEVPRGIRSKKNHSAASTAALAYEAEALTPLDAACYRNRDGCERRRLEQRDPSLEPRG